MSPDRIDLKELIVPSPEDLMSARLDVAFLQNSKDMVFPWAKIIGHATSWHVIPFEGLEHAVAFLSNSLPHILLTHWHIGVDHDYDNPVTQLVLRLKRQRGGPGIGTGPLIVGTYFGGGNWHPRIKLLRFIHETYDYDIELAGLRGHELIKMLAYALWPYLQK